MHLRMGNCRSDTSGTPSKKSGNRKVTLALFGLDNAGKTVTAKGFLGEEVKTPTPTIGFSNVDFRHGRHHITMFDLGGGRNIRAIWRNYFAEIHAAIFVVDASDTVRLDECKKTLADVLGDPMIQGKPLLLLANKQDVTGAMDEMDICDRLQLEDLVNAHKTPCRVESCSASLRMNRKMDESISDGFHWLMELVDERWNELSERVERDMEREKVKKRQEGVERAERVRRSRELREKEEKGNGGLIEEERVVGDPFKPIKNQLETSQKKESEERKKRKDQETHHSHSISQSLSKKPHAESRSTENISWKPPTKSKPTSNHERPSPRSNHRSDSEEDAPRSRSHRRLDLDDEALQRPSPRSRSGLDREQSSTRPRHGSDDENKNRPPKYASNHRLDSDEERMEVRRLGSRKEPLKPIAPTRITGIRRGDDDSVTDEDSAGSVSVYPSRTSRARIITPPVPLMRAKDAESHQKWNGHGVAENSDKKKKQKKARFNQTSPAAESPEPHSSWRNTYSASSNGDLFHFSSNYQPKTETKMVKTPLLQRLVEANALDESNLKRRTNRNDEEDDDEDYRPRTNARDTFSSRKPASSIHAMRRPNSHGYNYNDISDDDDDDDIVV